VTALIATVIGLSLLSKDPGTPTAPDDQEPPPSPATTVKTPMAPIFEDDSDVAKTAAAVPVEIPSDFDIEASLQETDAEFEAMEEAIESEFSAP
jgi:hypothetical protein